LTPATATPPVNGLPGRREGDQYLDVDGARIRYRVAGAGPLVVLVHGWTLDLQMWEAQSKSFQTRFRVARYDRRGFGLSTGTPSLRADAADLEAICRRLGGSRVALVGMSQGTRPVLSLAQSAPERVACVVLDGPPDIDASADEDALPRFRTLARSKGMEAFRRAWTEHPLTRLVTKEPSAHAALAGMVERYPGRELTDLTVDLDPPPRVQPEAVRAPALVLTGEFDLPTRARAADSLAARLPAAERVTIPGAGHLANLDNPNLYNQLVGAFLARHFELK